MRALVMALVLVQAADAASSCAAFRAGLVERNPVLGAGASCGRVVALKVATVAPLALLAPRLAKRHPRLARVLVLAPTAAGGVAVVVNLRALRKDGRR